MLGRIVWPLAAAAALGFTGALFLLGMPGVLFLHLFADAGRFSGNDAAAWTAMQRICWLAPLGVPPALWALWYLQPQPRWYWGWLAGLVGYTLGGCAAAQFV